MTRLTRVFVHSFFVFSLAFCATEALGQYGSSLEGVVTDQTGAAVAGAKVAATNNATGVARDTIANGNGFYRIPGLPPGTYTVTTEASSFKQQTTPDVVVASDAVRGLNLSLQPGPSQETVTVVAGTEALQTENANVSGTVTAEQVIDLPAFGRDPYQLVRLAPGVFADGSRQANGNSQAIPQQAGPGGSNSQIFRLKIRFRRLPTASAFPPTTTCSTASASTVWNGAAQLSSLPIRKQCRRSRLNPTLTRRRTAETPVRR